LGHVVVVVVGHVVVVVVGHVVVVVLVVIAGHVVIVGHVVVVGHVVIVGHVVVDAGHELFSNYLNTCVCALVLSRLPNSKTIWHCFNLSRRGLL
jgi:hypothetical protein